MDGCGLQEDEHTFPSFALHVFYNAAAAASVLAKNNFVKGLEACASSSGVKAQVGEAKPTAYADAASIALTSEQVVTSLNDLCVSSSLLLCLSFVSCGRDSRNAHWFADHDESQLTDCGNDFGQSYTCKCGANVPVWCTYQIFLELNLGCLGC